MKYFELSVSKDGEVLSTLMKVDSKWVYTEHHVAFGDYNQEVLSEEGAKALLKAYGIKLR